MKQTRVLAAFALAGGALLLGGCSSPAQATDPLIGTWGTAVQGKPQLVFDTEGNFSGSDGCNRVGGNYTSSETGIDFGPMFSTMMYCEGVDTWLGQATHATLDGKIMSLFDEAGTEIGQLEKAD